MRPYGFEKSVNIQLTRYGGCLLRKKVLDGGGWGFHLVGYRVVVMVLIYNLSAVVAVQTKKVTKKMKSNDVSR
ncbi:hypothetical protein GUJ93_ZPchr0010g9907 [Zizania palustris]|uniref:Uncharacterized protein n=1 Tax=Zizania palustris TaxID=103762 RepID=A0A8J5WBX1_ZIZPA|nr:hypothetical protein GUJ93_ZPchr0010g9907 [Zizania palustris]